MARFRNNYHCEPCNASWSDESNYTNNDECPFCTLEIEPEDSDDLEEAFDVQNIVLRVSARQRDALLCGLRNLQVSLNNSGGAVDDLPRDLRELMTAGDEHSGMESDEIDELCEAINVGPAPEPADVLATLRDARQAVVLLGNYIGNAWHGAGGIRAFDRCELMARLNALLDEKPDNVS